MFGMEAALFVPSGTMGNLIAGEASRTDKCQKHKLSQLFLYPPALWASRMEYSVLHVLPPCSDGALQREGRRGDSRGSVPLACLRARRECTGETVNEGKQRRSQIPLITAMLYSLLHEFTARKSKSCLIS